jgi:hypothetical protein
MSNGEEIIKNIRLIQESILKGVQARDYQDLEGLIMDRYELVLKLSKCPIDAGMLSEYLTEIKSFDSVFSDQAQTEREKLKKLMQGINKVKSYLNV